MRDLLKVLNYNKKKVIEFVYIVGYLFYMLHNLSII